MQLLANHWTLIRKQLHQIVAPPTLILSLHDRDDDRLMN
jgi:hypothetical protein